MLGIAGTIGAIFVAVLVGRLEVEGRGVTADEGVVGWVESVSEGGFEVFGVAEVVISDVAGATGDTGE